MLWGSRRASSLTLVAGLLLGPAALAQDRRVWVDPPADPMAEPLSRPDPAARPGSEPAPPAGAERAARPPAGRDSPVATSAMPAAEPADATATGRPPQPARPSAAVTYQLTPREKAARDLAFSYLDLWSAPNPVTLASAASFYGEHVLFHGRVRDFGSVLAEKRRFAQRWPDRAYRYRRETTQVACESGGVRCTVWSLFDFSAGNPDQGRRSRGIGEHELVVSFLTDRPVIVSETSRVLRRGWFETAENW